jgi:hypothetical protein
MFSILFAAASTFIFMKSSLGGIHLEGIGLVERGNPTGLVELVAWFKSSLYFNVS